MFLMLLIHSYVSELFNTNFVSNFSPITWREQDEMMMFIIIMSALYWTKIHCGFFLVLASSNIDMSLQTNTIIYPFSFHCALSQEATNMNLIYW